MRLVSAALCFVLVALVFASCQREKSFEVGAPARGSLKSDINNDCLPKTAVGAFIAGTALTDSNYLEVDVDVATEGAYDIHTETKNGYFFSGIGNFSHTGINRIRLAASGTPTVSGQDNFSVSFDTSICFVPVTVLPAGSNSGPAVFTLLGRGDSCIIANVSGSYAQNTPLNGTNTITIKVNVTTPGTYTVTTNTVNGFSFSGSNTFAAAGEQNMVLTASGTPTTEGLAPFTITVGTTTCTFPVNVTPSTTPPVATGDLFPLKNGSLWTYAADLNNPNDTLRVTNVGEMTFGSNTYQNFQFTDAGGPYDSLYYRKNGTDYFQYIDVNELIPDLQTEVKGEILFLKENLKVGDAWNTDFTTKYNNEDITLRFAFSCTGANTTEPVNGKSYGGAYKVTTKIQLGKQGIFTDAGPVIETIYAKGVGLISEKGNEQAGGLERYLKEYKI